MESIKDVNLSEILTALLRKAWLIVVCAVAAGSLAFAYTANFVTPMYRSSVKIYVDNKQTSTSENKTGVSASDLATSQRLVATYIQFLSTDTVLQEVANSIHEDYGLSFSPAGIRGMMSASALGETEIFQVSVANANPEHAAMIANAIAEVAPDQIAYYKEGSSTKIVDYAKVASAPYYPSKTKNTALGMAIGGVIAACIIVLQTLLDVRVKNEDDLAAISNAPVLGLIPDLAIEVKGDYGYKGYKSYTAEQKNSKEGKSA